VAKTLAEHLKHAAALFDAGETVAAGQAWRAIIKIDPSNSEAKSGLLKVTASSADVERYLIEGRSLYDSGDLRGALGAWEMALAIDPDHQLALSHARGVRKELGIPIEQVKALIDSGARSYETGDFEGAASAWSEALALDSENNLVKAYLDLAQSDLDNQKKKNEPTGIRDQGAGSREQGTGIRVSIDAPQSGATITPNSTLHPSPLAHHTSPITPRPSPIIPHPSPIIPHPSPIAPRPSPSLTRPRYLAVFFVTALLLSGGAVWFRVAKKDALLRTTQTAIRENAIKQASSSARHDDLAMTVSELCAHAKAALFASPLRAYTLAQEAVKRDPLDTTAAKLLEDAKRAVSAIQQGAPGTPYTQPGTLAKPSPQQGSNLNQLMASGNFDEAEMLLEARLTKKPDDMKARESLARVNILKARERARQGRWASARSSLLMGMALFPNDLAWRARLKLLDYLQTAPEDEQRRWIEMLG